jgi:tRNA pseudouridine55 synthase
MAGSPRVEASPSMSCANFEFALIMDGILIIDKPAGITSHDVVSRVRRILKTKRVGHTGTLDPFETGVMVILVGQATRLSQFLDKDEKGYEAVVQFGFETETGDKTGSPKSQVSSPKSSGVNVEEVVKVLDEFRGEIEQVPPMYSAKKIDGKKLYEHARKGETVDRKAVVVNIRDLQLIDRFGTTDLRPETRDLGPGTWDLGLRVVCSAGTYIRTLAEDIGRAIGVGAHLTELRRTRAGKFTIDQSLTLEQFDAVPDPTSALIPMSEAVSHLPKFVVEDERVAKTRNGMSTRVQGSTFKPGEVLQIVSNNGELIAIGFYNDAENTVQPKVVLV